MFRLLKFLKTPYTRLFLFAGVFLIFIPRSFSQYYFDANCRQAYREIISLRFSEAEKLIATEKKVSPGNLLPVYLENYIDFLTLIIGEDRAVYDRLKERKGDRISALEKGRQDSPFYNFCLGEINLQWAMARLKFGDYTTAAFEIRKASTLFSANAAKYPAFAVNKMGMGVIHIIAGLVPDKFKWVSNLIGLDGSTELGKREIRQVAEYEGPDQTTRLFRSQAAFYLAFLTLNLQSNKRDAMPLLVLFKDPSQDFQQKSPLMIYARATILMKNGFNDEALAVLQERKALLQTFHFYFLDYLEGMARLNKLDYSASGCFEHFISGFRGRNYLCAAYQKLAWLALLQGDSANYHRQMHEMLTLDKPVVDEDKQAVFEASEDISPNPVLLRARLLFDGGYYNAAMDKLLNNPVSATVRSRRDLVEYTYRLGRIYHEKGNFAKAAENYRQTVLRGRSEPWYFAASAAYQSGLLYENTGDIAKADSAYNLCLTIKPQEYRASLHQKARAGLSRLKKVPFKT